MPQINDKQLRAGLIILKIERGNKMGVFIILVVALLATMLAMEWSVPGDIDRDIYKELQPKTEVELQHARLLTINKVMRNQFFSWYGDQKHIGNSVLRTGGHIVRGGVYDFVYLDDGDTPHRGGPYIRLPYGPKIAIFQVTKAAYISGAREIKARCIDVVTKEAMDIAGL
jgi:hypothetical protein